MGPAAADGSWGSRVIVRARSPPLRHDYEAIVPLGPHRPRSTGIVRQASQPFVRSQAASNTSLTTPTKITMIPALHKPLGPRQLHVGTDALREFVVRAANETTDVPLVAEPIARPRSRADPPRPFFTMPFALASPSSTWRCLTKGTSTSAWILIRSRRGRFIAFLLLHESLRPFLRPNDSAVQRRRGAPSAASAG